MWGIVGRHSDQEAAAIDWKEWCILYRAKTMHEVRMRHKPQKELEHVTGLNGKRVPQYNIWSYVQLQR